MALAHINNRVQGGSSDSDTTIVSPAEVHTAGNGLVALMLHESGATVSSVVNTAGDTWVQAGSGFVSGGYRFSIFYVSSSAGHATDVVTVTLSAAMTYRVIVVHEISGQLTSGMLNTTASGTGTGGTISSGTITLAASEEFIVALMANDSNTKTAGSGYTLTEFAAGGSDFLPYYADEWKIVTASEAATATHISGALTWDIFAASFKGGAVFLTKPFAPKLQAVHRASSW